MLTNKINSHSRLQNTLETMRFLGAGSEASLYIYDIAAGRVYFTDSFDEKYHLPPMSDGSYSIGELMGFLRRDVSAVSPELRDLPEEIRQLCHSNYWLTNEAGGNILLKNEIRVEYSDSGRPGWVVGRLLDTAAGRNIDSLTGLFDGEKMTEDLKRCRQEGSGGYLMVLGIDNFRDINTRHGRSFGNQVIKNIAEILEEETREAGTVYRLDSDRFAVCISDGTRKIVEGLYSRIQKHCAHICTLSAGAAEYAGEDLDEIYQRAENTLELAKQQGKNMLLFFSPIVFERQLSILNLQDELRTSVANGFEGFFLTYQPQIRCGSYELFGAEALVRFHSPSRGLVDPDEFMTILEQSGLILEVGDWILKTALEQCRLWRQTIPHMHMSINMSYIQLRQRGIANRILQIVEDSGVPGSAITLEVTESMQIQDIQRFNRIFYKLEKSGIQIAIDDFGTGYSSLSYLKHIAIDEIKIDRCFITHIQHSAYNYRLLRNMIELARSAQLRVCCEGVETEEELAVLRELNPDLLQGYLFAKPWEPAQFEAHYLNPDSEEYIQCRRQQAYYRSQEKRFDIESVGFSGQERQLAATRDPLTRVFNRVAFKEEVTRHMMEYGSSNTGTLLLMDMDHLWEINDSFGHTQGETILRKTADILMSTFRRKDLIGRFGGDEFLVFLKNVTDRGVIGRRLGELRAALSDVDGHGVTCSVGAVEVRREDFSYDRSLHQADLARCRSKKQGRNTYCYFEDL